MKDLFPKKSKIRFDILDDQVKTYYTGQDADLTMQLFNALSYLKTEQPKIWGLEMALIRPNFEMELNGIDLDCALLSKISRYLGEEILKRKNLIFESAGKVFELNSNKQLGIVLYEELGMKCPRLTPKGNPKVDKETLAMLKGEHPIIEPLLDIGSLETKKNSFVDKMPTLLNSSTNRLHCSFIMWNVPTGRYSSSGPNLQNVPKYRLKDKESLMNIRNAFVANPLEEANEFPQDDDFVFGDFDYSQIELRVAASLAKEPVWFDAYSGDLDVHAGTAMQIYKVSTPTEAQRDKAKTGNFGILYGQSGYSFAMKNNMDKEAGEAFVNAWFEALPTLAEWIRVEKAKSRRSGFAYTHFGRRRPMFIDPSNGINCSNRRLRAFWERSVISHICQGTAADIMKLALVLVRKKVHDANMQEHIKTLLTVHDQILFKIRKRHLEEGIALIRSAMEISISGFVPLKVDLKVGTRWGSCVSYDKWKEEN